MSQPDDVLDRIDATLNGRCACGCGRKLDPAGPSAWFAGERCQRRWERDQAHTGHNVRIPKPTRTPVIEDRERIAAALLWRRCCLCCWHLDAPVSERYAERMSTVGDGLRLDLPCSRCGIPYRDPTLICRVKPSTTPGWWQVSLMADSDGRLFKVSRVLSPGDLLEDGRVQSTWEALEASLRVRIAVSNLREQNLLARSGPYRRPVAGMSLGRRAGQDRRPARAVGRRDRLPFREGRVVPVPLWRRLLDMVRGGVR